MNAALALAYQRAGKNPSSDKGSAAPAPSATPHATKTTAVPAPATPGVTVPNSPFAVTASTASSSSVKLAWHDNSDNETAFIVQRSTSANGKFRTVATVKATKASAKGKGIRTFADAKLAAGTTYYYRVIATNNVYLSGASAGTGSTASAKKKH